MVSSLVRRSARGDGGLSAMESSKSMSARDLADSPRARAAALGVLPAGRDPGVQCALVRIGLTFLIRPSE